MTVADCIERAQRHGWRLTEKHWQWGGWALLWHPRTRWGVRIYVDQGRVAIDRI